MKRIVILLVTAVCMIFSSGCGNTDIEIGEPSYESLCSELSADTEQTEAAEADETGSSEDNEIESLPDKNYTEASENNADTSLSEDDEDTGDPDIDEHGSYTSKEDVALYIHIYGRLPENFITKKEAEALGWTGGSLEPYAPGKCIGGSRFGNYEGLLPEKNGRSYTECDIDTLGASKRGAKRIVFSNDGLIYYTADHYESFELLYGGEE